MWDFVVVQIYAFQLLNRAHQSQRIKAPVLILPSSLKASTTHTAGQRIFFHGRALVRMLLERQTTNHTKRENRCLLLRYLRDLISGYCASFGGKKSRKELKTTGALALFLCCFA